MSPNHQSHPQFINQLLQFYFASCTYYIYNFIFACLHAIMCVAMITFWVLLLPFLLLNQLLGCYADSLATSLVTQTVVTVESFGAKGDGISDDTKAFQDAWKTTCSSSTPAILLISSKKSYRLKPITFSGPCQSTTTFMILGTLVASPNRFDWDPKKLRVWMVFTQIQNLTVTGGGTINGNGNVWWQVSCNLNKSLPCTDAPTALIFNNCKNLTVEKLKIINSPSVHVTFDRSTNVVASRLSISSPSWSPNTDGIHVTAAAAIKIYNSSIKTGDDCISMVSGAHNVRIKSVVCGPGHGISIGSLGAKNSTGHVSNVIVDKVYFNSTIFGVRIKTWQGGNGYAKNIVFKNIVMHDVVNPVLIDQFYCDSPATCAEQKSAVAITNIHYMNIKGTSAFPVAIRFNCSASVPCSGIQLQDINLQGSNGIATTSACQNANWSDRGVVLPPPCQSA
ncbi:Pectin lyase-like superfamily protein [Rhynchospora pubera]|uniref:endo-polygalacturonase n=1 Tax=Rhynchospora pubera TaxID=906938 RepID=A0AAV8DP49_9POAL|nr:Pectin lyase-like superfamily protein [Rhynchospora pubera]